MRNRIYFIDHTKLAEITNSTPRKVKEMCQRGELCYIRWGEDYLIPTVWLRRHFSNLPLEFWTEITEDLYRELDGVTSCKMRLERRRKGQDPATGEPIVTKVTSK